MFHMKQRMIKYHALFIISGNSISKIYSSRKILMGFLMVSDRKFLCKSITDNGLKEYDYYECNIILNIMSFL